MEILKDPCGDRHVKTLPPPPNKPLSDALLYPNKGTALPNHKQVLTRTNLIGSCWKTFFYARDLLQRRKWLNCWKTALSYSVSGFSWFDVDKEPNTLKLAEPIVIVGDIHGQVHDLVHMIDKAGDPAEINYLFLGDYVDRGIYGMEVMFILLAIKVTYLAKFITS